MKDLILRRGRLAGWITLVLGLVISIPASAGDTHTVPAEPADYRNENYRTPTPATLRGGKVVSNDKAMQLWQSSGALFIDVMPHPRKPDKLPPNTLWHPPGRKNIPGSVWLPNTGYGVLNPAAAAYLRDNLRRLTKADKNAPILFYCLKDCWMSWNAARRAIELGYSNVYWYPEGTDGWSEIGGELRTAKPVEPMP